MKSTQSEMLDKTNKERVGRLISLFEVKRPKRSPMSTLRKSKSISSLSTAVSSDEEETKISQTIAASCSSPNDKTKRRTKSTRSISHDEPDHHIKQVIEDIEKTNTMVDDFGEKLRMKRHRKTGETEFPDSHTQQKSPRRSHGSFNLVQKHNENHMENMHSSQSLDRRFCKKDNKKASATSDTPCRELIYRKRSKENKEKVDNFTYAYAKSSSDMETYRKNLVNEIDLALKKLKNDGFIDDDENSNVVSQEHVYESFEGAVKELENQEKSPRSTWSERLNMRRESTQMVQDDEESALQLVEIQLEEAGEGEYELINSGSDSSSSNRTLVENSDVAGNTLGRTNEGRFSNSFIFPPDENLTDDEFGESLAEDLEENGSYFVEAYNDDGKELIIVEIAVERRAVDLNSLEAITQSIENSDIVFHQNEDKSLNLIDNPKEFVSAESISNGFITSPDSNRSTVYSVESRDSEVFDTDDEGISLGNGQKYDEDNIYNNVRRETFCDNQGIVRIERVGYPEVHIGDDLVEPLTPVSRNNSFTQKGTLSYIIDEIKSTERKYLEDLHRVVTKYKPYIEEHTPPHLLGRQCYIFGNIDKLYSKQKEFLVALENCGETVDGVLRTFIDFEKLFKLYPRYFKNKPKADIVLKEFSEVIKKSQAKFEERLDLSSYLLTPLQRLGKYKLFLENIEKQLKKLDQPIGSAELALDIIKGEMSKGNDFVAIESIENSPINKEDYGSFKMREKFNVIKPRRFEAMVFLFENIIVFTMCDPKNMDTYNYYTSIKMMDLRIATFEDLTIHLTDFTLSKRISRADRFTYVLEAKTQKIKETWRKAVEEILWQQLVKAKENTLKMYQASMSSKKNKAFRKLIKSTGASTFYID